MKHLLLIAKLHNQRITWLVGPLMLAEMATAVLLLLRPTALFPPAWAWVGLILLGGIWFSTFALQVPQHTLLADGFDPQAHHRLVVTNWIRTAGWTARSLLTLAAVYRVAA